MAPRVDPVTSDTELPARTGVVIVVGAVSWPLEDLAQPFFKIVLTSSTGM